MLSNTACPDKSGKSRFVGKNLFTALFIVTTLFTSYSQDTIHVPVDYTTIQAGIDAANNGDIVLVAEDTYYENINFNGKAITVASHFLNDGDTSHISNTIINGSQPSHPDNGSVVYFISGEDTTSIICGFTITGGTGTGPGPNNGGKAGGGIYCNNAGAKIIYNKITWNETLGYPSSGGGIYSDADSTQYWLVIENNFISNNHVETNGRTYTHGGGITISAMHGKICNNIIWKNNCGTSWESEGGGIYISGCSPIISNNIITGNKCYSPPWGFSNGGGISLRESNSILLNNVITDNRAEEWWGRGGGIYINDGLPIIINNTIVNNNAGNRGGGIALNVESIIMNSIVWGNTAPSWPGTSQIYDYIDSLDVFYSDIQDGWSGTGNINVYPEFVDTANGDYHLSDSSLCIGTGIDSIEIAGTLYYCPVTDLKGNPRPNPPGTMPDMGAYEFGLPVGVEDDLLQFPKEYFLAQNYPNPFNPSTTIRYQIPKLSFVTLKVYDVLGSEVAVLLNEEKSVGAYELTWYAENLPSGIYFYRLQAGSFVETKKMILLR